MTCLTTGHESLTRKKHGVAYNLVNLEKGAYIVTLLAVVDEEISMCANATSHPLWLMTRVRMCSAERHAVQYLADFELPTHADHRGAIIDNDPRVGVRMLNDKDRTLDGARTVFDDLFWTATSVRVTSVWKVAL